MIHSDFKIAELLCLYIRFWYFLKLAVNGSISCESSNNEKERYLISVMVN